MIKNAKFSGYYFDMNLNIWGDFQICISVPLRKKISLLFRIKLKQFHILVHIANCSVYLHHMYIFQCNNFKHFCV